MITKIKEGIRNKRLNKAHKYICKNYHNTTVTPETLFFDLLASNPNYAKITDETSFDNTHKIIKFNDESKALELILINNTSHSSKVFNIDENMIKVILKSYFNEKIEVEYPIVEEAKTFELSAAFMFEPSTLKYNFMVASYLHISVFEKKLFIPSDKAVDEGMHTNGDEASQILVVAHNKEGLIVKAPEMVVLTKQVKREIIKFYLGLKGDIGDEDLIYLYNEANKQKDKEEEGN